VDAAGKRVDAKTAERIRALAIPPAWEDVWICDYENGHIQAVGTDAAGRRQYLYHPAWRERRDREKFDEMVEFAKTLPELRATVDEDLGRRGYVRERVLACAVRLLDLGFFRIGGEDYAEQNETYGLATLQRRHVEVNGSEMRFDFVSKGGKRRVQSVVDPQSARLVAALKRRPGRGGLFSYKTGTRWVQLGSNDVNAYIKDATENGFSAKDFRTWNATVLASVALAVSGEAPRSKAGRERVVKRAVEEVAHYLGNTPAIARNSYIDPRVFDRFRDRLTIGGVLDELGEGAFGQPAMRGAIEDAVVDLLERDLSSPGVEKL
jgi:DNA topoisomerase IB